MDKRTVNTLLNAVDRAKADRKHLQMKQEEQAWKKLNNPCNLIDALSSLTKIELDRVRKNLGVKGVSVLKKSELVSELAKIIPSQFEHLLYQLDHERYDLIKKIVNNSGSVTADDFPFSKIKSLKEYSIIFPGTYLDQKVLFMPSELIEIFPKIDGTKLQTTVGRNTEWIRLTHGMLYYYGVMEEIHSVIKKLNLKDQSKPILILNAPKEYDKVVQAFDAEVHTDVKENSYSFIQIFGTSNQDIQESAKKAASIILEDGLFWLCYPKKSSKIYKGSNCSRDTVATILTDEGYEPVRQIAVDEDWSALRFRKVEKIKKMIRKHAVTEKGKKEYKSNKGNQ